MILDGYSRYVAGWIFAKRESAKLATELFEQTIAQQRIDRGQLTIHADHGRAEEIVANRTTVLAFAHQNR